MSFGVGLTAKMQQAMRVGRPLFLFAAIDHPDGMVYLWNGTHDIEWDGNLFRGKGALGTLSQVSSSSVLQINERTLTLRGIEPEQTEFLSADVRKRIATFWLGCTYRGRIVPDPYLIDEVEMDAQQLPIGENGNIVVQISGYSGLWTLQRAQNLVWSPEQAKTLYPAETGFDQIPVLVNKETKWTKT